MPKPIAPTDPIFSLRLLTAQSRAGLRVCQLAELTGLKAQSIANIQAGVTAPHGTTLIKLAKALDCSTDYLCGLKEDFK